MANRRLIIPLPTNDAIFLYFLSLRPGLALRDLDKIYPRLSKEGKTLASDILDGKYKKPIPICTDLPRYVDVTLNIDKILKSVGMYSGGQEAVMGFLKFVGVLNQAGNFRRSK
jgi:hypothetical protein